MKFKDDMTKFKFLHDVVCSFDAIDNPLFTAIYKEKYEFGRLLYQKYSGKPCTYNGITYYIIDIKINSNIVITENIYSNYIHDLEVEFDVIKCN